MLAKRGVCAQSVVDEVELACHQISTAEVYAEEKRIGHDMRALVNCIRKRVSEEARPYVHMTATSYDIIDTANAARYKDVIFDVLLNELHGLVSVLKLLAHAEAETVQIGRTYGQHAVPITFGFSIS